MENGELTLREIILEKTSTEEAILDLIKTFQTKTGLKVKDVIFLPERSLPSGYGEACFKFKVFIEGLE